MKNNKKNNTFFILLFSFIFLFLLGGVIILLSDNQDEIDDINISIKTIDILISSDATNWSNEIGKSDLVKANTADNKNQLPDFLGYTSTIGYIDIATNFMQMFNVDINTKCLQGNECDRKEYFITSSSTEEKKCYTGNINSLIDNCNKDEQRYVAFDIYLKTDKEANLYLSNISKLYSEDNTSLVNGLRVAFLVEGNISLDEYNSSDGILLAQNLKKAESVTIWEPNYDIHSKDAILKYEEVFNTSSNLKEENNERLKYYGIKSAINEGILYKEVNSDTNNNYFMEVEPNIITVYDNSELKKMNITLNEGVTKIRIYVWLEAMDIDSLVDEKIDELSINLGLINK